MASNVVLLDCQKIQLLSSAFVRGVLLLHIDEPAEYGEGVKRSNQLELPSISKIFLTQD